MYFLSFSVIPDAPSTEQQELFTQKLQQCCMLFDFLDSVTDLKSKEIKRATLNELVDYVSTNRGVLVESAYPEITDMVRIHLYRAYISLLLLYISGAFFRFGKKNSACKTQSNYGCTDLSTNTRLVHCHWPIGKENDIH